MEIFEWGPWLERWSGEWLDALAASEPEEFEELDEDIVRSRWLGFGPAGPARLAALEERVRALGIASPLPPSLRAFLETTDGWRYAGGSVYLLAGAEDIVPYGDPSALRKLYEDNLGENPAEQDVRQAGMWGRALQMSLDSDMTDVLLDPGDVGADGEWAVYVHRGWSGDEPERYASFRAYMEGMYKDFYRSGGNDSGFENAVTHELDDRVEEARLACLRGELDEALAAFDEAADLGRPRARVMASQLRALLERSGAVPLDPRMDDPLYAGEVLPLKVRNHLREGRSDDRFVLGPVTDDYASDRDRAAVVLEQIKGRTYEYVSPGVFGRAVEEARELARWGDTDGAWRVLAAAVPRWEPYGEDHVAPIGLLGDPLLGPVITPERGRELLLTPRAGQGEAAPVPAATVGSTRDGLAWLARGDAAGGARRDAYRFVLVAGIRPEELAERFGTGPLGPVASEMELMGFQYGWQRERRGPLARIGAVGRTDAADNWSFTFESHRLLSFNPDRLTHPATGLSHGTRALTVWRRDDLFHFAYAEDGEECYGFMVHQANRAQWGDLPAELTPDHLFPNPTGPAADRSDEDRALHAIADLYEVSLPRFALTQGRLPTLSTRPWTGPAGPGEGQVTVTVTPR
ncbi:SMI1/KNR4 family protein [Streptomyces sp. Je 1-369]|uniref:SMI1/KNR4 family protein n=1 Tax=Streptomyces sp. Je 1-369 TaxID=2966192 RepID=UPI002286117F|nr:SMI1/KNR4 family protein [Streptomyces sp. Je 1-369]WAL94020.1 SMI1/KNR4 family protein [Streptomyces sp. Je 1-369]